MEQISAPVEDNILDTSPNSPLSNQLANLCCGRLVGAFGKFTLELGVDARGGSKRDALSVINDLRIDVLR